jgi:hypothetical protein
MTTRDVQVMVCSTTNESSYAFCCPACGVAVSKAAEPDVVDVLVASGVRLSVWDMPAELDEPRSGPPISHDDLLDFHFQLQSENCLEELLQAAPGPAQRGWMVWLLPVVILAMGLAAMAVMGSRAADEVAALRREVGYVRDLRPGLVHVVEAGRSLAAALSRLKQP